jgi:hypothetical protein
MADLVSRSLSVGAVTVAPWGFGKWLGSRGRLVASYLERVNSNMFFVGDSGARLAGTPEPAPIRRAAEKGIRNLPGSDPFPFPRHQARVARRGFMLDAELDPQRPSQSLTALLAERPTHPARSAAASGRCNSRCHSSACRWRVWADRGSMKILLLAPHSYYVDRGTPIDVDLVLRALSARGEEVHALVYPAGQDRSYPGVTIERIRPPRWIVDVGPGFSLKKVPAEALSSVG